PAADGVELGMVPRKPKESAPPRPTRRLKVLVIDDEPALLSAIVRELEQEHDVDGRTSFAEAVAELRDKPFDLVLCDVMMPGVSGMDIYTTLCQAIPEPSERIVFMTGGAFTHDARSLLSQVPNRCLEKPFSPSDLEAILSALAPRASGSLGTSA